MLTWTNEDAASAEAQGWNVFEIDGDAASLAIEKSDQASIFSTDSDAITFVIAAANSGDTIAKKALEMTTKGDSND